MDINDIQARRAAIENHILDQFQAFEAETSTRIEHVHIVRRPGQSHSNRDIDTVYVDVEIGRVHEIGETQP